MFFSFQMKLVYLVPKYLLLNLLQNLPTTMNMKKITTSVIKAIKIIILEKAEEEVVKEALIDKDIHLKGTYTAIYVNKFSI